MTTIQFNRATVICTITSSHIFVVWLYLESYINRGSGAKQKIVSSNIYGSGGGGDGGKVFFCIRARWWTRRLMVWPVQREKNQFKVTSSFVYVEVMLVRSCRCWWTRRLTRRRTRWPWSTEGLVQDENRFEETPPSNISAALLLAVWTRCPNWTRVYIIVWI